MVDAGVKIEEAAVALKPKLMLSQQLPMYATDGVMLDYHLPPCLACTNSKVHKMTCLT